MQVTARLAPSPTGLLHIGHARSFLLAWLNARAAGGRVLLRIEDLDATRSRPEFIESCMEDIAWLGLDWDEEPHLQSSRSTELLSIAERLVDEGAAYPCVCTRKEVREASSAPHLDGRPVIYPGTCRGRFQSIQEAEQQTGRRPTLRFRCPEDEIHINDLFQGEATLHPLKEFGDFPIASPDGQTSYHLAVVLDDDYQGVTEVLRGDDLLSSCGPQAALQAALGIERPTWIHVPLVLDEHKKRLAKRTDGLSVRTLREQGHCPRDLVGWLLSASGLGHEGPTAPEDAIKDFSLSSLSRSAILIPEGFPGVSG